MSTPERLVIVAPNWLGDAVMALPLVRDVRCAWPEAHLAVAARASVAPLYSMVSGVDAVVALDGGGGLRALRSVGANAEHLRSGGFDTAVLLPNSFLSAWMASRAGIAERWGFRADWRSRLLTRAIARPPKHLHQADYYQALGAGLGIAAGPRTARVEVPDRARQQASALLASSGLEDGGRYVAMAPGAAYGRAKQWLPDRFAELARLLHHQRGVRTVLVGARADASVCRTIAARAPHAIDLAARTDLPTLAGVLAGADAAVSNDSGAMHLAAAVGARVVAIFGATNERRTAPLEAGRGAPAPAVVATDVWCRPCMLRECPIDHRCMTGITARDVLDRIAAAPTR